MIQIFKQKEICLAFPYNWEWLRNIFIHLESVGFSFIGRSLGYCEHKNKNEDRMISAKEENGRKNWYYILDIDIQGKKMQILNFPMDIEVTVDEKQYLSILNEIKAQNQ